MSINAFQKVIRRLQKAGFIDPKTQSNKEIEAYVLELILGIPSDIADQDDILALFGKNYIPGTFMISEIKDNPDFFSIEANIGYHRWIKAEIQDDIQSIKRVLVRNGTINLQFSGAQVQEIEKDIIEILEYQLENDKKLCDLIALQEYTDIFRRLILLSLVGNPDLEVDTYAQFNAVGRDITLSILSNCNNWSLFDLLKISLASGLVGLNLKTSASATSKIYQNNIIPIYLEMDVDDQVRYITQRLEEKAKEEMAISYWQEYRRDVIESKTGIILAFFTDDYIETIFDLKFIEKQLYTNKSLRVYVIPRFLRYGNDACYSDIIGFLDEPCFEDLKSYYENGRFQICRNGPKLGAVNGLKISQEVAAILKKCNCVVVKGARSYEMLQGIKKITYFGFAVCREISESVTGIDAEKGKLVFIRQSPGIRSFEGFKDRKRRCCVSETGRKYYLSTITAKDFYQRDYKVKYLRQSRRLEIVSRSKRR